MIKHLCIFLALTLLCFSAWTQEPTQQTHTNQKPTYEEALILIKNSGPFGYAVGVAAIPPRQISAICEIATHLDAEQVFVTLFKTANTEGKMFALLGLIQIHSSQFLPLAEPLLSSTDKLQEHNGCMGPFEESVSGTIKRLIERNKMWDDPTMVPYINLCKPR